MVRSDSSQHSECKAPASLPAPLNFTAGPWSSGHLLLQVRTLRLRDMRE